MRELSRRDSAKEETHVKPLREREKLQFPLGSARPPPNAKCPS